MVVVVVMRTCSASLSMRIFSASEKLPFCRQSEANCSQASMWSLP